MCTLVEYNSEYLFQCEIVAFCWSCMILQVSHFFHHDSKRRASWMPGSCGACASAGLRAAVHCSAAHSAGQCRRLIKSESVLRSSTFDQVIVVDVDDFLSLVDVCERDRPARADLLVEVHRALVVAVVQASRSDVWVELALVDAVHDWLNAMRTLFR